MSIMGYNGYNNELINKKITFLKWKTKFGLILLMGNSRWCKATGIYIAAGLIARATKYSSILHCVWLLMSAYLIRKMKLKKFKRMTFIEI